MLSWSAVLGFLAFVSAAFQAAALSAESSKPRLHHQEASYKSLGITHQGKVHHVSHGASGAKLMRVEQHAANVHDEQQASASGGHDNQGADVEAVIDQEGYLSKESAEGQDQSVRGEQEVGSNTDREEATRISTHHKHHASHKGHRHGDKHRKQEGDHASADRESGSADEVPVAAAKGFSAMMPEAIKHQTQEHEAEGEHAEVARHGDFGEHGELVQTDSEFLPALGLSNPSDLAYRAMDMMMGIASVIPEDYPFVCICLDTGTCDENMPEDKKTPCPSRIGQKAGGFRSTLGSAALFAAVVAFLA